MKTRRSFLKKVAAGTALASIPLGALKASVKPRKYEDILIHHVFFWLKNPKNQQDRTQFEKAIEKLTSIEVIRKSHLGVPAPTEEREVVDHSYTYSLMLIFNSKEDQDIYQIHQKHQDFVDNNQQLWEKVVVYDSVDA